MGTSNSSTVTRERAASLADEIGAPHHTPPAVAPLTSYLPTYRLTAHYLLRRAPHALCHRPDDPRRDAGLHPHTHTSLQPLTPPCALFAHPCTPLDTPAHPCTPLLTLAHPCTPLHTLAHPSQVFKELTKKEPRYKSEGGTHAEDVALQNIQAAHALAPSHPRTLAPSHPHAWVCAALHPLTHHACRTHPPPHAPPPVATPAPRWC